MKIPPRCDLHLFQQGRVVLLLAGPRSSTIEEWILKIRERTGQSVDWHFVAGRAVIKTLGNIELVKKALRESAEELVDAYMACPNNYTTEPARKDVLFRWM